MSTLKVDTILKRTGTGTITVGQSGDTISIPSGATLNVAGSTSGITNTPLVQAGFSSASQAISSGSDTEIVYTVDFSQSRIQIEGSSKVSMQSCGKLIVVQLRQYEWSMLLCKQSLKGID